MYQQPQRSPEDPGCLPDSPEALALPFGKIPRLSNPVQKKMPLQPRGCLGRISQN